MYPEPVPGFFDQTGGDVFWGCLDSARGNCQPNSPTVITASVRLVTRKPLRMAVT